jgi:2-dehydropantoate 2-reductase
MKTLVVGTGIIGTTWGWALSNAGINVTHLVRPGNKDRYKDGVTLDLLEGRKGHKKKNVVKYELKCVETISASDPYDLIIVSVNFNKIDAVLDQLVPLSGDALFLIFGANWFGVNPIEKHLPKERYLLGFPRGGGTQQDGMHYSVAMDS